MCSNRTFKYCLAAHPELNRPADKRVVCIIVSADNAGNIGAENDLPVNWHVWQLQQRMFDAVSDGIMICGAHTYTTLRFKKNWLNRAALSNVVVATRPIRGSVVNAVEVQNLQEVFSKYPPPHKLYVVGGAGLINEVVKNYQELCDFCYHLTMVETDVMSDLPLVSITIPSRPLFTWVKAEYATIGFNPRDYLDVHYVSTSALPLVEEAKALHPDEDADEAPQHPDDDGCC